MAKKKAGETKRPDGAIPLPPAENVADVPSTYANTIQVLSMNHIDVRLAFNEVVIEEGKKISVVRRANIVMPTPAFLMNVQLLVANAQNLVKNQNKQAEIMQSHLSAQIQDGSLKQE